MTRRQKVQLIGAAGVLALAVVACVAIGWRAEVGLYVPRCIAFFRDAGPWPFFTAMAVLPALGLPISPFAAVAGPVFGPTMGVPAVIACTTVALAVNVAGCYWIAARWMRPLVERLVRWTGYTLPQLPPGTEGDITLLVRLVPGPPFFLQSYVLGLARVPFGMFMRISMLVQATYLGATIVAGDALARGDWRAFAAAGVLFVAVGFVLHRLRKRLTATLRRAA